MHCDHAFYVGGTHENAQLLGELERLPGCCGIKVFMGASTGTLLVQDDEGIEQVLRHINRAPPSTPRTNTAWPTAGRSPAPATGPATTRSATPSRRSSPPIGWCGIATALGKRIHVLHVTTADEIAYLAAHKDVASVELTPQHLTLAGPRPTSG
jgi:dihydroorotase